MIFQCSLDFFHHVSFTLAEESELKLLMKQNMKQNTKKLAKLHSTQEICEILLKR